ncbi:protein lin-54 homolog [Panonychus citri]|uniref:protein lin-54 homolog n=1 Tax=Panonychus citri TaxID=50023 RepID=UPI0023078743|nr:protein lin-54 homolog [Panonychus citri]
MASEDIIFQNVGSEVSIDCCGEELVAPLEGVSLPATSTKGLRRSKASESNKQSMLTDASSSQLLDSTGDNQPSNLAQFITSIRPPSLIGTSVVGPITTSESIGSSSSVTSLTGVVSKNLTISGNNNTTLSSPSSSNTIIINSNNNNNNNNNNSNTLATSGGGTIIVNSNNIFTSVGNTISSNNIINCNTGGGESVINVSPAFKRIPSSSNRNLIKRQPQAIAPAPPTPTQTTTNTLPASSIITKVIMTPTGQQLLITSPVKQGGDLVNLKSVPFSIQPAPSSTNVNKPVNKQQTSTPTFLATGSGGLIMVPAQFVQQQTSTPVVDQPVSGSVLTPISTKSNQIKGTTSLSLTSSSSNTKQVTLAASKPITSTPTRTNFVPIAPSPISHQQASVLSASQILAGLSSAKPAQNGPKLDNDPNRPRKPCNCTKSQCLKLYCDCFANGEFCNNCNCINCANNLKHEEERQKAIKQCLERNPHAFHPKIGKGRGDIAERRHTKGCNCRRSGCLKNYCECYEAKILCSELCKCISCKNYEDSYERKTLMHLADAAEVRAAQQSVASKSHLCGSDFRAKLPVFMADRAERTHCSFITNDVIEATSECLLAQADAAEKEGLSQDEVEKLILEEFGRCLRQIIESANNSKTAKANQ